MTIHTTRPTGRRVRAEALLTDGTVVTVRPVVPGDLSGLAELHRQTSELNRRLRFFTGGADSSDQAEQYAEHLAKAVEGRLAVVAERDGELLGVASAEPVTSDKAEVALLVADRMHHTGVGTLLLEHLAASARATGVTRFEALVLLENSAMFDVFVHAGFDVQLDPPAGSAVLVTLDLRASGPLASAVAERERRAVAASIAPLLAPRSVVVIGAGRSPGGAGRAVAENLVSKNFHGRVAVINPHVVDDELIAGGHAYRTIADVPWRPELAVIAVPAGSVAGVLEECGQAGIRGAVVLGAGFGEDDDTVAQADLVAIAHRHGVRLIGPDCLGVLNTDPAIRLDATFARTTPRATEHGGVGLAAQSKALGVSVLDAAWQRGIGISSFVSLGNKADVSGNDMLLYWVGDPRTSVIALYLESIGNARRFRRIAAEVAWVKPIVALRSGRSAIGPRTGTPSRTAAAATPDASTRALFRDAGVIAVETTEELIDLSMLLSTQPVPAGRRLLIVGNAGGPAALAADAAHDAGAVLSELAADTMAQLKDVVSGAISVQNPVNLGANATPADYAAALRVLHACGAADCLVVVHVATGAQPAHAVIQAIEQAELDAARPDPSAGPVTPITVAAVLIGAVPPRGGELPWFGFAESAARAVARAADLGSWRARSATALPGPVETPIPTDVDVDAVTEFLRAVPRSAEGWLADDDATGLLRLLGIPVLVADAGRDGDAHCGHELLLGLSLPGGGVPIVMVAAGGRHEDLLGDRVLRTLPLMPGEAAAMVSALRCAPILSGHRGSPPLAQAAVPDVLARLALLDLIAPEVRELDVNPLIVGESGVLAAAARVRLAVPGEAPRRRDPVNDDYQRQLG